MGKRASRAMEASRSPEALSVGVGITAPPPPLPPLLPILPQLVLFGVQKGGQTNSPLARAHWIDLGLRICQAAA